MTVQNAAINIESLGNLRSTAGLSMPRMHIIIITWIGASKIKVFMIGWEKELLTKTGLIMKKEATKGSMSGRKANGAPED